MSVYFVPIFIPTKAPVIYSKGAYEFILIFPKVLAPSTQETEDSLGWPLALREETSLSFTPVNLTPNFQRFYFCFIKSD